MRAGRRSQSSLGCRRNQSLPSGKDLTRQKGAEKLLWLGLSLNKGLETREPVGRELEWAETPRRAQ